MFEQRRSGVSTHEKRRAKRTNANAPAIVETTASRTTARIVNVSASGARLVTDGWAPARQDVQIIVGGLYLFGRIAWRRGETFAVKFEEGLHGYTPEEIHRAVEDASEPIYELDRDVILSALMNREPRKLQGREDTDVAEPIHST